MSNKQSNSRQIYKENQIGRLEVENIIEIKNSVDGLNSKLNTTKKQDLKS